MKIRASFFVAFILILSTCASPQTNDILGDWSGTLRMGGGTLRLIFHIGETERGYTASIESVDQGGVIIPAQIDVEGNAVSFVVEQLDVEYTAIASDDEMVGTFNQLGNSMPNFTITRN